MRSHQESVLVFWALGFLLLLFAYTGWGIAVLTKNLTQAITVKSGEPAGSSFHFEELKKLNLPGIE